MISKNYFKYLLKSLFPLIIVCAVIGVMSLGLFPALTFEDRFSYINPNVFSYIDAISGEFMLLVGVAFAVPFVIHSRYFSKNSSDIYLSLPLNRKQAFITENVFGLMVIVGSTLIGFLFGLMITGVENCRLYLVESYPQILQTLPIILLTVVTSYLIAVVAVSVSNSMIEAIFVMIAINGISLLVWGVTETFFSPFLNFNVTRQGFSYSPIIAANLLMTAVRFKDAEISCDLSWYSEALIAIVINLVIWLVISYVAYRRFISLKSEHLGTASMEKLGGPDAHVTFFGMIFIEVGSLFGEAIEINLTLLQVFAIAALATSIAYWVSLFVLRRKIIFRKDDVIRFAIAAIGGIVLGLVLNVAITNNKALFPINY